MDCELCHTTMDKIFGHISNGVECAYTMSGVYETEYVCENEDCYLYNKIIFVWTEVKNDTIL